jgi:hypothetical protein
MANQSGAVDTVDAGNLIAEALDKQEVVETEEVIEESVDESIEESAEIEEPEEVSEEVETEEVSEDSESEAPEEVTEETFENVAELAEAMDLSVEDFMQNIHVPIKVQGEEMEVTLADLKNGYQMESDYRRKTSELAEQRKAFEAEKQEQVSSLQSSIQQVNAILTNAEQDLMDKYNSVNWDELKEFDKEDYLIKQNDFAIQAQKLKTQREQAAQTVQTLQQQQAEEDRKNLEEYAQNEAQALITAIPDWQDPKVRDEGLKQVYSFAKEIGITDEEINQMYDHRLVRALYLASQGQNMSKKIETAKKKVKPLKKFVKPGSKPSKQEVSANASKKQWAKVKKTGSMDDLGALIASKLPS